MVRFNGSDVGAVAVPALRGRQAGRIMYILMPNLSALGAYFRREVEASPEDNVQRTYQASRAVEIGEYIEDNPAEFVLGSLTYSIDVPGVFEEVEPGSNIGKLYIPLDASLKCIDGQHRAGGVREAMSTVEGLRDQHVGVVLYVEPELASRRQMFSDMNSHQRAVAKSVNVSFDSRDPFARVARDLSDEHPLLKGRVERELPSVRQSSEKLFTLGVVYDALGRCFAGVGGRVRNKARFTDREIQERGQDFFDVIVEARQEYRDIISKRITASELRTHSILASGPTLKVLAGAFLLASQSNVTRANIVARLARVDFSPSNADWTVIGFTSEGKNTPNSRLQEMKAATSVLVGHLRQP